MLNSFRRTYATKALPDFRKRVKHFKVNSANKPPEPEVQQIALHQIGDRELFYIAATDGSWKLPMFVEWRHDRANDKHYALILPAVTLYASQHALATALFKPHDILESGDRWLVSRRICEAILHKAPGITPRFYYLWPDGDCPPMPADPSINRFGWAASVPENATSGQPFIKHVSKASGIPSSIVSVVFKAICDEAPKYMVETKRHIDFGFCRAAALPFRINWKEIVAFKCRSWKLKDLFTKSEDDSDLKAKLEALGLQTILCSPDNIALSNGRVGYTLEVVPTVRFKAEVEKEEARMQASGHTNYVANFEYTVEKLYDFMVQALGNHVKKAAQAFAKVRRSGTTGVIRFLPVGSTQMEICGIPYRNLPTNIIPPATSFNVLGWESDPALVREKDAQMQKMSDLSQEAVDLRRREVEADVEEPRQGGDSGVPLLLASEVPPVGEPMLVEPEDSGDGLDQQGNI